MGPKFLLQIGYLSTTTWEVKIKPNKDMDIRIDVIQSVTDIPECMSIS